VVVAQARDRRRRGARGGLALLARDRVLRHDGFASALAALLGRKLADAVMSADRLESLARATMDETPSIVAAALADLVAIRTRDPAARLCRALPLLQGLPRPRMASHRPRLYSDGRRDIAAFLQSRVSEVFAIDIHPAVPIGSGVFIDHGNRHRRRRDRGHRQRRLDPPGGHARRHGKERGDRHPKVRDGVLLSAGAKVLGNMRSARTPRSAPAASCSPACRLRHRRRRPGQDRRLVPRDDARLGDGSEPARLDI